ncbi:unnamed protein product [Ectocarpus sp. 12 AP-2014]
MHKNEEEHISVVQDVQARLSGALNKSDLQEKIVQGGPSTFWGKTQPVVPRAELPDLRGLLAIARESFRGNDVHWFRSQVHPRVEERPVLMSAWRRTTSRFLAA